MEVGCGVEDLQRGFGRGSLVVVVRLLRLLSFPFGGNGRTSSSGGRGSARLCMRG